MIEDVYKEIDEDVSISTY